MQKIQALHDFGQIQLLADARRLQVLRLLMAGPCTLTQLARSLKQSPAWVRHHLLALETAGLVELDEVRTTGKVTEKLYRSRASAFMLRELILPVGDKPAVLFAGSDDPALNHIAMRLAQHVTLLNLAVGSLDGLIHLRQGMCQLSGSHLLDPGG